MATIENFKQDWFSSCPYIEARSSGSTGAPKVIRLSKADMKLSARATNKRFGINSSSVLASPLSIDYIAGKMMYVRAWEANCRMEQLEVSNKFSFVDSIDLLAIVPSQVDHLVELSHVAERVRNVIIGGSALSAERAKSLLKTGINAYVTYGMTETCSHVALAKVTENEDKLIYHAMPGISFGTDERSCLIVNAPEYSYKQLITNDIVRLVDNGSFVWSGRYDNIINSGGIKFTAEELEREIAGILPTLKFYIIGVEDRQWGEVAALVYEGNEDRKNEILSVLSKSMNHKRLPKHIICMTALPRTSNGKIKRVRP